MKREFDKDNEYILTEFRNVMLCLAASPREQVLSQIPGCITCDLLLDFESWYNPFVTIVGELLTKEQLKILEEIDLISEHMSGDEFQCLYLLKEEQIKRSEYEKVLTTQQWTNIRKLAQEFNKEMEWTEFNLPRYIKIEKQIWIRD